MIFWLVLILGILTILNIVAPMSGTATVTPLLASFADPQKAIAFAAFYFAYGSLIRAYFFRKNIRWDDVRKMLPISLVAASIGALIFVQLSEQFIIGLLIAMTAWFIYVRLRKTNKKPSKKYLTGYLTAAISGFLQGTGVFGGSDLRNNYFYSKKFSLSEVVATTALIGGLNFVISIGIRVAENKVEVPDLYPLLLLTPMLIASTLIGRKLLNVISDKYQNYIAVTVMFAALIFLIHRFFF